MKDRIPVNPGRVLITPEDGSAAFYATMTRADNPTEEGTKLNKANLLKDATAALFGFGADAVPDEALAFLGKYAQHWWKRRSVNAVMGQAATVMAYSYSGNNSGTAYYSDSYIINGNGEIELVNPSTVDIGYTYYTGYNNLKGKYFYTTGTGQKLNGRIWFMPSNAANATRGTDGPDGYYVNITAAELSLLKGDVECITASSQDAYPYSGYADGYLYEYLGIPFDNAVNAPKFEVQSYTGTGLYGSTNANSLVFDFEPSLLIIAAASGQDLMLAVNYNGKDIGFSMISAAWNSFSGDTNNPDFTWGKSVSWYSYKNAIYQMNSSGKDYVVYACR